MRSSQLLTADYGLIIALLVPTGRRGIAVPNQEVGANTDKEFIDILEK